MLKLINEMQIPSDAVNDANAERLQCQALLGNANVKQCYC